MSSITDGDAGGSTASVHVLPFLVLLQFTNRRCETQKYINSIVLQKRVLFFNEKLIEKLHFVVFQYSWLWFIEMGFPLICPIM